MNKKVFEVCKRIPLPQDFEIGEEYIFFNYVAKKKDFKRPVLVKLEDISLSGTGAILAVTMKGKKHSFVPNTWTVFDKQYMLALETQYFKLLSFYQPNQLLKRDLSFISDFKIKYPEHTI